MPVVGTLARRQARAASTDVLTVVCLLRFARSVADDWGWGDVGVYGAATGSFSMTGTNTRTPNLDALARNGTLFTDFHTGQSYCAPSRTAFMTGKFPQVRCSSQLISQSPSCWIVSWPSPGQVSPARTATPHLLTDRHRFTIACVLAATGSQRKLELGCRPQ
jgi:hypothetical protein